VQTDGEAAVLLLIDELVRAPVPDLDGARPVVSLRDLALEVGIVERVILDVDGQRSPARLERDALGDSPAGEGAAALQPKVVVEPPRVVPLDDEDRLLSAALGAERLRRGLWITLLPIFPESGDTC
jgi:hypothetical protein